MGERQGVQIAVLPHFILSGPPMLRGRFLEGFSTHILLKILVQKPQCSEKTVSSPSTQSTLSKGSCVMPGIHKIGRISSADRASGNGIKISPEDVSGSEAASLGILSLGSRCGVSEIDSVLCSVHILILCGEICL